MFSNTDAIKGFRTYIRLAEGEDPDWIVFILMRYLRYMVIFGKKILYVFIARGKQKCYLNNMILVKYQ